VNVATPSVLNITELLRRVENDRELVSELFLIFRSVFPSHLQRLSETVTKALLDWEMPKLDGPAVCREGIFTLIVSLVRLLAARFRRPYVFLSIETSSAASPR
jgi:hypothetical protein